MRLLAGALAGRPGTATLVGDASLSSRPMERVAGPLREVGATIETTDGHAPLRITGRRPLRAMAHRPAVASAQVIGCLSLAALAADGTTSITVPGPTRDHTERMLAWLGAPVRREGLVTTIDGPAGFAARSLAVPGDISSAAAWLVAGALHPTAEIRLEGVGLNPSRVGIIDVLREMGADIEVVERRARGRRPSRAGGHHHRARRSAPARHRHRRRPGGRRHRRAAPHRRGHGRGGGPQRAARRGGAPGQGIGPHRARGGQPVRHRSQGRGAPGRLAGRPGSAPGGAHPHARRPSHRHGLRHRRGLRRGRYRIASTIPPARPSPTLRSGRTWRPSADDPATLATPDGR